MKRIILYLTTLLFLLFIACSNVSALANSTRTNNTMEPAYVATQTLKVGFTITSGTATCTCRITPKTTNSITSAHGNFKIINNSGKVIKTYSQSMEKSGNIFRFNEKYKLPAKGTYYLKATVTCYKNGTKQEDITKASAQKTY